MLQHNELLHMFHLPLSEHALDSGPSFRIFILLKKFMTIGATLGEMIASLPRKFTPYLLP